MAVKADISKIDQKMNWNFGIDTKPFNRDYIYMVKEGLKAEATMLVNLDFNP
ncbi:MAG: hypothetical protein JSV22_13715 [Bacteroidales bacterium]|nr:MAG: hypothetical protein JSV22_13715 [Bacteroidales bacterium]